MKNSGFKDIPGHCLKCGNPLPINQASAYCSFKCEKADEDYYIKMANSKIGAQQ